MAHRKLAIIRRRTFTAVSVLSLLLCVATLALWVLSYSQCDSLRFTRDSEGASRRWRLNSKSGRIECEDASIPGVLLGVHPASPGWYYRTSPATEVALLSESVSYLGARGTLSSTSLGAVGFVNFRGTVGTFAGAVITQIWITHWFLALLFAILPALRLRGAIRSRRRHRAGHCPRCGYDLRATPERCPECGTALPSVPPASLW